MTGLDNKGKIILEYTFAKKYLVYPYHILFLGERDNMDLIIITKPLKEYGYLHILD